MTASSLQIHLDPNLTATGYVIDVTIKVTIHNTSNTPITFLNWSTPMDPNADILGVFDIHDADTGEIVHIPTIEMSRRSLPFIDDLVEVPATGMVEAYVELPRVPLFHGHRYTIQAQGSWHALWKGPIDRVTNHHLENLSEAEQGEFESEVGWLVLD
ncbi:hypothetical protein BO94DRAFT_545924 [Aspergillus sclerotioniger CBS 115572]|uniref:Uncharacterized protein n=1 Tax=Aspergillus sclerotioniger CBS 115572 TaxID=1450535 RepID=A0A317WQX7_9EURO|nr:hypothetical protein BO94DRAFT_545924 [Aspergillus sclerotioniger CBS 115572]PWY88849.1 hypothetical protein BO94DRAFT_545924 [Aspergillus sclerotioniger CBS 115572]